MQKASLDAMARRLLGARLTGAFIPAAEARLPDLAAGYAVQAVMERILAVEQGHRRVGWKIGAAAAASQASFGLTEPFFGRLYEHCVAASPARLPASPIWRAHEPEIALRLGRDLDPSDAPFDAAAIAAATEALLPAIEVVAAVAEPWREAGSAALVADNAAFGFWVTGEAVTDWSGLDLLALPVRLLVDGAEVAQGRGDAVAGGAFGITAWLANAMAAQGLGLRAGDYVTTGSVTTPVPAAPRQHVVAVFEGLGEVVLDIGPA